MKADPFALGMELPPGTATLVDADEQGRMRPEALDRALAEVDGPVLVAAQAVEHYEIAGYGTARTYARQLGFNNHVELLQRTLDEEGQTDERLTKLAESRVNPEAQVGRGR